MNTNEERHPFQNYAGRLRRCLQESGLTQAELSRRTGLSSATMYRAFSGDFMPSLKTLKAIAEATGTSLDYLRGLKADPAPEKICFSSSRIRPGDHEIIEAYLDMNENDRTAVRHLIRQLAKVQDLEARIRSLSKKEE